MKENKRIMIWGSNLFLGLSFDDKLGYVYLASSSIMQLRDRYQIENFSMNNLSTSKALAYIYKALDYDDNFDAAIVELGFADLKLILDKKITLSDFEKNLRSFMTALKNYRIETYLSTLSPIDAAKFIQKEGLNILERDVTVMHKRMNRLIKDLAEELEVNLFDDNKTLSKDKKAYVSSDGISLNQAGQNVLKNMIIRKNL